MSIEFISSNGNIDDRLIRLTGNVEILENYLKDEKNRKKLSSNEIKHLKHRIETMKELNKIGEENKNALRKNERKSLIAPIEREDGTIELAHIHQDKVQNTFNGCWSVSLQLLLQSRGVKLTQERIRGFRHNYVDKEEIKDLDEETEKDINTDRKNEMINKVDLVMKVLPNTAVNSMTFVNWGSEKKKEDNVDIFKKIVRSALIEDCSPISMVSNGHFRTIVGIKGDEVLLKDSIPFRTHGANHTYRVSIKEILKESTKLFWLHDLKMEKDGSCAEFSGNTELTYKDGAIEFQDMKTLKNSKGVIIKRKYDREMAKEYRGLRAEEGGGDAWTKDARAFRVETRKYKSEEGKFGAYNMFLPHKIYEGEPRKIRRYTEAEIELIDRLNGREVLEDIQMILSTPDKNGLYPAMTEKNLEDLNTAYEKVSKLYGDILNDKKVSLSQKQRNHLQVLKGRVDREKQIFSTLKKNESGVLPTYRDALRQGMRALETGAKNPYEAKAQALQRLQDKFAELEKQGHKNSKEYTEMVKAAKNLQLVAMAITDPKNWEKLGIEQVPNEDQVDSIVKRAEDIAVKAVEKYVNEKGNPYTEFGKKRLAVAKELQEELSNSITIFREERTDELMKEVARQKAKILESKPKELEKKQDDTLIRNI